MIWEGDLKSSKTCTCRRFSVILQQNKQDYIHGTEKFQANDRHCRPAIR